MIFDILFLPVLFFIATITCYEDFKYGKVRNKWILFGLSWGFLVITVLFIWYFIAPENSAITINPSYLGAVLWNFFVSIFVVFLMWRFGAWAAGDAKLFLVFSLLLPLKYYSQSYLSFFPSFVLLANTFLLILLYLLLKSFFYGLKSFPKDLPNKIYKIFSWDVIRKKKAILLSIIWIFLVLGLFSNFIEKSLHINVLFLQIAIFASFIIFSKFWVKVFKKKIAVRIIIILLVGTLGYGLIFFWSFTLQILIQALSRMLIFLIIFGFLSKILNFYVSQTSFVQIKTELLSEKMNLSDDVLSEIKKKDKEFFDKYLSKIYADGLIKKQVEAIKNWTKINNKFSKKIEIYKPFPFVVWMFLGLLVTIFLKTSIIYLFIKNIFSG